MANLSRPQANTERWIMKFKLYGYSKKTEVIVQDFEEAVQLYRRLRQDYNEIYQGSNLPPALLDNGKYTISLNCRVWEGRYWKNNNAKAVQI